MYVTPSSPFTVSLSLAAHAQAEQFRRQQSNPTQGKRVYLNTLAVYAVYFYLDCLDFELDLAAGHSWQPVQQMLLDTADLVLPGIGKLECRPVLPDATTLDIPPDVWEDRIGYVAVHLSSSLREANLLGFVPQALSSSIPLDQLQPMETLVNQLTQRQSPATEMPQLSQWLQHQFYAGWQATMDFLDPRSVQAQPAFNFRSQPSLAADQSLPPKPAVSRCKTLQLDTQPAPTQVVLLMGLLPLADDEIEIWVQLSPPDNQGYLPQNLQLIVLDEDGSEVMQAQARSTEAIQLKLLSTPGETFSIKVALDHAVQIEQFIV